MPWGNTGDHRDFEPQRHDDGCIEVIGFTMASLVRDAADELERSVGVNACNSGPRPPGGAAGRWTRREAAPVQRSSADYLQDRTCAGEDGSMD